MSVSLWFSQFQVLSAPKSRLQIGPGEIVRLKMIFSVVINVEKIWGHVSASLE